MYAFFMEKTVLFMRFAGDNEAHEKIYKNLYDLPDCVIHSLCIQLLIHKKKPIRLDLLGYSCFLTQKVNKSYFNNSFSRQVGAPEGRV